MAKSRQPVSSIPKSLALRYSLVYSRIGSRLVQTVNLDSRDRRDDAPEVSS
jgi:hypothetical protein